MRYLLALCLLPCLSLLAQAAPSDLDQLQGTWQITALLDDGMLVPEEVVRTRYIADLRVTFSAQSVSFLVPYTFQPRTILFVLDEKANPKTIDLGGAEKVGGKGIYLLQGDTLMVCLAEAGVEKRPAEFSAPKASPQLLMTFKRVQANPPATTQVLPQPQPQPQPVAIPAPVAPPTDDIMRKMLIATWGHQDEDWIVMFTLNADGTFSSERRYKDKFGKLFHETIRSSGTWKLENGVVVCTTTVSTDKHLVNQIFSYRITSITATELTAVDQFGKWRKEWKAP
jgi:uncharacterized protein (TIGR03067 family)